MLSLLRSNKNDIKTDESSFDNLTVTCDWINFWNKLGC